MGRRTPIDEEVWPLFVEACGGKCCACGKLGPLERGHIKRHVDGGPTAFENLVPLCKKCNGKNSKGLLTDATKPADWRAIFCKLITEHFSLKIEPRPGAGVGRTDLQVGRTDLTELEPIEIKGAYVWGDVQFVPVSQVYSNLPNTPSQNPNPEEIMRAVQELVGSGKNHWASIRPPGAKTFDAMQRLAGRHGIQAFLAAGKEYIRQEKWVGDKGFRLDPHPWETFVVPVTFNLYLKEAGETAARKAKQADEEREQLKRNAISRREDRWKQYLKVVEIPLWDGITAEDAAFITEAAAAEKGNIRDIPDDLYERSIRVCGNYRFHQRSEERTEKEGLRGLLEKCAVWAMRYDAETQQKYMERIKELRDFVNTADMAALQKYGWAVTELHDSLNPETIGLENF
jgi:hypothetical protein